MRILCALLLFLAFEAFADPAEKADFDAMYSQCIEQAGPINNGTVAACSNAASEAAKKEMSALYGRIYRKLGSTSPQDAKQFEQTQKAWLTYRNGQCKLAGAYVGSPMFDFCPMKLNIARVKELRDLAGE